MWRGYGGEDAVGEEEHCMLVSGSSVVQNSCLNILATPPKILAPASARKKGRRKNVDLRIEEGVVVSRGSRADALSSSC